MKILASDLNLKYSSKQEEIDEANSLLSLIDSEKNSLSRRKEKIDQLIMSNYAAEKFKEATNDGFKSVKVLNHKKTNCIFDGTNFFLRTKSKKMLPASVMLANEKISNIIFDSENGTLSFTSSSETEINIYFDFINSSTLSSIAIDTNMKVKDMSLRSPDSANSHLMINDNIESLIGWYQFFDPIKVKEMKLSCYSKRGQNFIKIIADGSDLLPDTETVFPLELDPKIQKIGIYIDDLDPLIVERILKRKSTREEYLICSDYEQEQRFYLKPQETNIKLPFPPVSLTLYEGDTELEIATDYNLYLNGAVSNDLSLWPTLTEEDNFYIQLVRRNYESNYWALMSIQPINNWNTIGFHKNHIELPISVSEYELIIRTYNIDPQFEQTLSFRKPAVAFK